MDFSNVWGRHLSNYRKSYGAGYGDRSGTNLLRTQNNLFRIENVYMDDDEGIMKHHMMLWDSLKYFAELDNYKSISEFKEFVGNYFKPPKPDKEYNKRYRQYYEHFSYYRKYFIKTLNHNSFRNNL